MSHSYLPCQIPFATKSMLMAMRVVAQVHQTMGYSRHHATLGGKARPESLRKSSTSPVFPPRPSPFNVSTPQPENSEDSGEGHKHPATERVVVNLPGPNPSMAKPPTPPMPKLAEKKEKPRSDQAKPTSEGPESAKTVTPDILLQPVPFEMNDPNQRDEQSLARVHAFYKKRGPEYRQAMMRKYLLRKDAQSLQKFQRF